MDINRDVYQTIEQYLRNQLNSSERTAFEAKMAGDKVLKEEVETYRLLIEGVQRKAFQQAYEKDMRQIFQDWEAKQEQTIIHSIYYHWQTYAIAAAAILILVMGYFFITSSPPTPSQELATTYNLPDPAIGGKLGSKPQEQYEGDEYYGRKEFDKARTIFISSLKATPNQAPLQYRMGLVNMAHNHYEDAISYFTQVSKIDTTLYAKARWYTAIAYLGRDEPQMAREVLTDLSNFSHKQYARKAEDLLKEMDELELKK